MDKPLDEIYKQVLALNPLSFASYHNQIGLLRAIKLYATRKVTWPQGLLEVSRYKEDVLLSLCRALMATEQHDMHESVETGLRSKVRTFWAISYNNKALLYLSKDKFYLNLSVYKKLREAALQEVGDGQAQIE